MTMFLLGMVAGFALGGIIGFLFLSWCAKDAGPNF